MGASFTIIILSHCSGYCSLFRLACGFWCTPLINFLFPDGWIYTKCICTRWNTVSEMGCLLSWHCQPEHPRGHMYVGEHDTTPQHRAPVLYANVHLCLYGYLCHLGLKVCSYGTNSCPPCILEFIDIDLC